jgi:hypothetical protein
MLQAMHELQAKLQMVVQLQVHAMVPGVLPVVLHVVLHVQVVQVMQVPPGNGWPGRLSLLVSVHEVVLVTCQHMSHAAPTS